MLNQNIILLGITLTVFSCVWCPSAAQGDGIIDDDEEDNQKEKTTTTPAPEKFFNYNTSLFDPNREFEMINFDEQISGGFNIDKCLKDLMDCWNIMRAETLCHYQNTGYMTRWANITWWGSACDIMRDYCSNGKDLYVPETKYWFRMEKKKLRMQRFDCNNSPKWT